MKAPKRNVACVLFCSLVICGCGPKLRNTPEERIGKIYYLDGAGNYGFGQDSVPTGLRAAGYRGDVEVFNWTSLIGGALLDQVHILNALAHADTLAKKIDAYLDKYPRNEVNLVGLSAGTGVMVWAVENITPPHKVNNLVLLGSSLSNTYDMTKALERIKGKVYVYHSPKDPVLTVLAQLSGTIDRRYGVACAGVVGLKPPHKTDEGTRELYRQKVVNIPWRPGYEDLGYVGDHTSATSSPFVAAEIGPRIVRPAERRPLRRRKHASARALEPDSLRWTAKR